MSGMTKHGFLLENVGNGRCPPSSPPVVSGDPSEQTAREIPDYKCREYDEGQGFLIEDAGNGVVDLGVFVYS
jgi:hypothetical protein